MCGKDTAQVIFYVVGGVFRGRAWLILEVSLWSAFAFSPRASFRNLPLAYSQSTDNSGEHACAFFFTRMCMHVHTHTRGPPSLRHSLFVGGSLLDSFGWGLGDKEDGTSFEKTWLKTQFIRFVFFSECT